MKFSILTILLYFVCITNSNAQKATWSLDLNGGLPYNIPSPLIIKQNNEPTLHLMAHYFTEPMKLPIYWDYRISRCKNNKAWDFELIHHKLYLRNLPPEVHQFSISHGYNILLINRAYTKQFLNKHAYKIRIGAGIVLSHPENEVRNKKLNSEAGLFNEGYYLTGPILNLAIGKRYYFLNLLYLNTELKFNPSFSLVPIAEGNAYVWNFPIAFTFGLGMDFIKVKK